MKNAYFYETKLGKIIIAEDGKGITNLSLAPVGRNITLDDSYVLDETEPIKEAAKQLMEYLEGTRRKFTVKLNLKGTLFQLRVWEALKEIPYGKTCSYKEVALAAGNGKAFRAVGRANHDNPVMCIIPCHRVIGADGSLVGYAGGLDIKKYLLKLEQGKEA